MHPKRGRKNRSWRNYCAQICHPRLKAYKNSLRVWQKKRIRVTLFPDH